MAVRIGELLLKEKRITPDQLQEALNYQKANGGKLGFNLAKLGFVKDEELTALLSKQYGVPSINLAQFESMLPSQADSGRYRPYQSPWRSGATLSRDDRPTTFRLTTQVHTGYTGSRRRVETRGRRGHHTVYALAKAGGKFRYGGSSALEWPPAMEEISARVPRTSKSQDMEAIAPNARQRAITPVQARERVLMSAIQKVAANPIEPY